MENNSEEKHRTLPEKVTVLEGNDIPEPKGFGYKATNGDMSCRDMVYELGKWYKWNGAISLCEHGFHFCKRLVDCFRYYAFDEPGTRIFSVEVAGAVEPGNVEVQKVALEDGDTKCVAEKIRLVRELSKEEIYDLSNQGKGNEGILNKGNNNKGSLNRGNRNTGDNNNGDFNEGDNNNGSFNTGNHNRGSENIGNGNKGDKNIGSCNLGNCNQGDNNIGAFNKCSNALGYLNTESRSFLIFDKPTDKMPNEISIPDFMRSVGPSKGDNRDADYDKEDPMGWRRAVEHAQTDTLTKWKGQLDMLLNIPNFDYEKFKKISGLSKEDLETPPKPTLAEIGLHAMDYIHEVLFDMRNSDALSIIRHSPTGDIQRFMEWVKPSLYDLCQLGSLGVYWGGRLAGVIGILNLGAGENEVMDRWFGVHTAFRRAMDRRLYALFIPFFWVHPNMREYSYLPYLFDELMKVPGRYVMATPPYSDEFMQARGFTKTEELVFPDGNRGALWERNNTPQFISYRACIGNDAGKYENGEIQVVGTVHDLKLSVSAKTKEEVLGLLKDGVKDEISKKLACKARLPMPTKNKLGERMFGEMQGVKCIDFVERVTTDLWSSDLRTEVSEEGGDL